MRFFKTKHGNALINELLQSTSAVPLETLEEHLKLSRRSIFYTIKQTNIELLQQRLDPIENVRGSGYQLSPEVKQILSDTLTIVKKAHTFTDFFENHLKFELLNKHDRILLLQFVLISRPTTSLNQLVKIFNVSKNTVLKDLYNIKKTLPKNIILSNEKNGKTLTGSETALRRWVFENFRELLSLISPYMNLDNDKRFNRQLNLLERITGNSFTDDSLALLNNFMKWSSERVFARPECELKSTTDKADKYSLTYTWAVSLLNDIKISSSAEATFLAEIVNTQAFQHISADNAMIPPLRKVAAKIIRRFNEIAGVNLPTNDDTLNKNLTIHLVSTYYRVKYKINYQNPLVDKIKTTYKETFEIVKLAIQPLNDHVQQKLSDDEIALITVYFSGALRNSQELARNKDAVLVICSSGIGTSELLISQLRSHYPDVNFIGPYNTFEYENIAYSNIKLVISTINLSPIQESAPVLTVPVIPNNSDWQQIEGALQKAGVTSISKSNKVQLSIIMDIIANHARIVDPQGLKSSLRNYINSMYQTKHPTMQFSDIVYTTDVIQKATNWQNAIQISLKQLKYQGIITTDYINKIIELTKNNGDYMAIGKGIFLAHAAPNAGVNHLGFSYTLFKQPFLVNGSKTINFVVGVAPVDQQKHLHTLGNLLQFIQNEQWMTQLHKVKTSADLRILLTMANLING